VENGAYDVKVVMKVRNRSANAVGTAGTKQTPSLRTGSCLFLWLFVVTTQHVLSDLWSFFVTIKNKEIF
jgi:hypothetical protein